MRFNCVAVLVVTSLLACVGSASTSSVAQTIEHDFPAVIIHATKGNGALGSKRMLRTYADEENEDRVFDWAKLKIWLSTDQPTSFALERLKLNEGVAEALASKRWKVLEKYVNMVNEKHPEREVSLYKTLRTRYKEDDLAKALVTATQSESATTRKIATALEQQQFAFWRDNSISPDDVFFFLGIKADMQHAMHSRKLETLEQYIPIFNERYQASKTDMFTVLRKGFGDADFARALAMAKQERTSATMRTNGENYQKELFSKWMAMGKDNEPFDKDRVMTKVFKLERPEDGTNADRLALNHYSVFYKRMREQEALKSTGR